MKKKIILGLLGMICFFAFPSIESYAEIAGDDAFTGLSWEQVHEDAIQAPSGIVQSICATEDYIICIENTVDNATDADTVSAYYKNDIDENGNPVERYSLAKRVSDTNWEHGNGMTYNPNTNEIYVALYTDMIEGNKGCIYVMDPATLAYKRTVKISDEFNILGIDYMEDTDQYVIQTNADGGYSFKILDADFQIVEDLGSYANTAKGHNFQDLVVDGDYIINFPLTLNMGIGDYLHVYSVSRKMMVADVQLDFKFENIVSDEPEALCEIEPGVYLAVVNVTDASGAKKLRFYRTEIPYLFDITVVDENGKVIESSKVSRGESFPVDCRAEDGYQLASLIVNGEKEEAKAYEAGYTLENIQKDYTVQLYFKKIPTVIPKKTEQKSSTKTAVVLPIKAVAVSIFSVLCLGVIYCYYLHIRMERRRKHLRARRRRRQLAMEY